MCSITICFVTKSNTVKYCYKKRIHPKGGINTLVEYGLTQIKEQKS